MAQVKARVFTPNTHAPKRVRRSTARCHQAPTDQVEQVSTQRMAIMHIRPLPDAHAWAHAMAITHIWPLPDAHAMAIMHIRPLPDAHEWAHAMGIG